MQPQLNRSRFFVTSWYMGAGGLINVFSVKPYKPYIKIKSFYVEELEKLSKLKGKNLKGTELTEKDKVFLREKIKLRIKRENRKKVIVYLLAIIVFSFLVLFFLKFFDHLSVNK